MAELIKKNPLRMEEQLMRGSGNALGEAKQTSAGALEALKDVQGAQAELADRTAINAELATMRLNRIGRANQEAQGQFQIRNRKAEQRLIDARAKEQEVRGLNTFQILGRALTGGDLGIDKYAEQTRQAALQVQGLRKGERERRQDVNTQLTTISKRLAIKKQVTDARRKELDTIVKTQSAAVDITSRALQNEGTGLANAMRAFEVADKMREEILTPLDIPRLSGALANAKADGFVELNGVEFGPGEISDLLESKLQGQQDLQNSVTAGRAAQGNLQEANNTRYIKGRNKTELQQIAALDYQVPTGEEDAEGNPVMVQLSPEEVDKQILALDTTTNERVSALKSQPGFVNMARKMSQLVDDTTNLALKLGSGAQSRPLQAVMDDAELLQDSFDASVQLNNQRAADAGVPVSAMAFDEVDVGVGTAKIAEVQAKFDKVKKEAIDSFSTNPEIRNMYTGYINGTRTAPDQALLGLAQFLIGGAKGLDISDPINAAFAGELEKEFYKLAKRHEFDGTEVALEDMGAQQSQDLMAAVLESFRGEGKDDEMLGRPQLTLAISNASRESQVRRIESYYGRAFGSVSPEERRRTIEAGGLPEGLANFQIQQAFETARMQAEKLPEFAEMNGRQRQELDAQLTLQALSLIPLAGGKSGREVFLAQLGTNRSEEVLAEMTSAQKDGTFVDYMIGQSGVQRNLQEDVFEQNQLFVRAAAGLEANRMENLSNIVGDLKDPDTRAAAVARVAVIRAQGSPEQQEILTQLIRQNPALDGAQIAKAVKTYVKRNELRAELWEDIWNGVGAAWDAVAGITMFAADGTLDILGRSRMLGAGGGADQAAADERRRLEAGEGR